MELWQWLISGEHWKWLSPPSVLAAVVAWFGRRKGLHPWEAIVRQFNLNREITACRQDVRNERQAKEYAMRALEEMVRAGTLIKQATEEGRLTIGTSSNEHSPSPRTSIASRPRRRRGPLDLP